MTIMYNGRRARRSYSRDYVRGASSIFNLRGDTRREYPKVEATQVDSDALAADWVALGADMDVALTQYRRRGTA